MASHEPVKSETNMTESIYLPSNDAIARKRKDVNIKSMSRADA